MTDDPEEVARLVIESVIPGARMTAVQDQSAGQYDFDLSHPEREPAVVEVTAAADPHILSTTAAIFSERAGGNPIHLEGVTNVWLLEVRPGAQISNIRAEVADHLRVLEAAGVERFVEGTPADPKHLVTALREELGVLSGGILAASGPGRAYVQVAGEGSLVDPLHLNKAVGAEAWKDDNRRKLREAGTAKRHLFVYVHESEFDAWIAMNHALPPDIPPNLPEEVTDLWVAAHHIRVDSIVYWRVIDGTWADAGWVQTPPRAT